MLHYRIDTSPVQCIALGASAFDMARFKSDDICNVAKMHTKTLHVPGLHFTLIALENNPQIQNTAQYTCKRRLS